MSDEPLDLDELAKIAAKLQYAFKRIDGEFLCVMDTWNGHQLAMLLQNMPAIIALAKTGQLHGEAQIRKALEEGRVWNARGEDEQ